MALSFEFFPPKTPKGVDNLLGTAERLNDLGSEYFSVTYGAGGSTRDGTFDTVARLIEAGFDAAPHLSMGSDDPAAVVALLEAYRNLGVKRIVALRGDLPSGFGRSRFANNAEALVRLIRAHFGDQLEIEVAAYPEGHPDSPNPYADLEFFKRKVEAGASGALTQYFYHPHAYFDFVERARAAGITIPIVPGVMPITNHAALVRFSRGCGAEIPMWIEKRLATLADNEPDLRAFGVDVVGRLCADLLAGGAPGLHFYTLNRAAATQAICDRLNLIDEP